MLSVVNCQVDRSREKYQKTRFMGSKSFKIIVFSINRKGICDFLLVVNSNVGSMSHGFGATATYWSKTRLSETYRCLI